MPLIPWGKRYEAIKAAEEMLAECVRVLGLGDKKIAKSGREWIAKRAWGEDVCEMKRVVCYAALTATGEEIEERHFPPRTKRDHEAFAKGQLENVALEEIVRHKFSHFFDRLGKVEASDVRKIVLDYVERPLIGECLKWAKGNQLKAARVLGLNRNTLRKRMKELKIKAK